MYYNAEEDCAGISAAAQSSGTVEVHYFLVVVVLLSCVSRASAADTSCLFSSRHGLSLTEAGKPVCLVLSKRTAGLAAGGTHDTVRFTEYSWHEYASVADRYVLLKGTSHLCRRIVTSNLC